MVIPCVVVVETVDVDAAAADPVDVDEGGVVAAAVVPSSVYV